MLYRFQVYDVIHGQAIDQIEMDDSLLKPEAGIVDPDTLSMPNIKRGKTHTLIPFPDPTIATLTRLHQVYNAIAKKPLELFSSAISRQDALIQTVGLLFSDVEFKVVECLEDLDAIINPVGNKRELKTAKYSILGDLAKHFKKEEGESDEAEAE